jgi:hypothetical protein
MSFVVTCPSCQTHMQAPEAAAGRAVRCPRCHKAFGVPSHALPPAAPCMAVPVSQPSANAPAPQAGAQAMTHITVNTGAGFPHKFHLIMTLCTCGMWAPVWLIHYLIAG